MLLLKTFLKYFFFATFKTLFSFWFFFFLINFVPNERLPNKSISLTLDFFKALFSVYKSDFQSFFPY